MKIINMEELNEFTSANDFTHVGGEMWEDAGGHIVHEDEILGLMEEESAKALNHIFGDVAGALDKLTIIK
jgi:hypothetical protein